MGTVWKIQKGYACDKIFKDKNYYANFRLMTHKHLKKETFSWTKKLRVWVSIMCKGLLYIPENEGEVQKKNLTSPSQFSESSDKY